MRRALVLLCLLAACGDDAAPDDVDASLPRDAFRLDAPSLDAPPSADAPTTPDAGPPRRALILHDFIAGPTPIPTWIRDNRAHLETLPFDGIAVYMRAPDVTNNVSASVMQSTPLDPAAVASVLAPLADVIAGPLRESLVLVLNNRPGDLFDDAAWATAAANFGILAAALRDLGVRGVFFDNEEYGERWGDWDAGGGVTLDASLTQARLRGRQIMEAMVAEYPAIVVLTLHGPYISEPGAPIPPFEGPFWPYNENLGAFFAGFIEGAGDAATVVDGGEIYSLRADADFAATAEWRRTTIASDTVDSAFIPPSLRPLWPMRIDISFGLYDQPFRGATISPEILEPTMASALRHADRYVWMYTEGRTFLTPGGTDAWLDAIRNARATTGL